MKTVLITGGSSGIGEACAELFLSKGYKVYNFDLKKSLSKNIETIICDITDEESVIKAFSNVKEVDVLVNCAGIFGCYYVEDTPSNFLDKIVDVNMKGNFLITKYALPYLRKSNGNIVFISSGIGINADPTCPAYCMTKAGINMFVKCLALTEIKNGVRVNAVLPGPINTPLLTAWFSSEEEMREYAKLNPQNLIGEPIDVARVVLFLSDESNKYINGSFVAVDGGESISSVLPKYVKEKK